MIIGVGTDILKIQRIRNGLDSNEDAFVKKCYSAREQEKAMTCADPALFFATRFAGKEAVFKCLGVDGTGIRLNEIEIMDADTGQPQVSLLGTMREIAKRRGIKEIHISLSYEDDYAVAFAVAQG